MDGTRSGSFTQVSVPDGYDRFLLGQLFEPWAADMITRASLKPGCRVLDVASGLGPVARLAAQAAGPGGRVVASDISPAMLAVASARPHGPGWAAIEYLQCPASAIAAEDDSFDVVLCQHGLQFFPDRAAAVAEMRRVARPGGTAVMSTWAAGHPLGLFGPMIEAVREAGIAEPGGVHEPGHLRELLPELDRDGALPCRVSSQVCQQIVNFGAGQDHRAAVVQLDDIGESSLQDRSPKGAR